MTCSRHPRRPQPRHPGSALAVPPRPKLRAGVDLWRLLPAGLLGWAVLLASLGSLVPGPYGVAAWSFAGSAALAAFYLAALDLLPVLAAVLLRLITGRRVVETSSAQMKGRLA